MAGPRPIASGDVLAIEPSASPTSSSGRFTGTGCWWSPHSRCFDARAHTDESQLVDLDAERPNTGAALSTWLDNAIAGVPELAVCYHRADSSLDVLQTDDIAALCAPPFDPDVILAYAARVLEFLQHHCADDGSQYWLLGDGSAEGGLHLYDVTKGIVAASVGDERPGAGTTGGAEGGAEVPPRVPRALRATTPGGRFPPRDSSSMGRPGGARRPDRRRPFDPFDRSIDGSGSEEEDVPNPGRGRRGGSLRAPRAVASVLSPSAHPAMFSAYKEELAAASRGCLTIRPNPATSRSRRRKRRTSRGRGRGREGDGGWSWEPAARRAEVSAGLPSRRGPDPDSHPGARERLVTSRRRTRRSPPRWTL